MRSSEVFNNFLIKTGEVVCIFRRQFIPGCRHVRALAVRDKLMQRTESYIHCILFFVGAQCGEKESG